jgi:hypothetical protein
MKKVTLLALACGSILLSCQKEEGFGGNNTLTGKVYVQDYNSGGVLQSEYYGPDERVFLVFGDDPVYSEEMRTHYDGTFRFDFLYPGKYTVFAYSECDTCAAPDVPVMATVEFTNNKEVITTGDLVVRR